MTPQQLMERELGIAATRIERFPTGLCHRVYRVTAEDGKKYVLRLSDPPVRKYHDGNLHWLPRIAGTGAPVPKIIGQGLTENGTAYTLLTYLPGSDLGQVYATLTDAEKRTLAQNMAEIQRNAATIESPGGYGFTYDEKPGPHPDWQTFLERQIHNDRERIRKNGVCRPELADGILELFPAFSSYFAAVPPRVFLDDATTKNVLVHEGRLSGLVDVDCVCLGDGLFTLGLTRMALLNMRLDTDYIDHWLDALGANAAERRAVSLYTLMFCFGFMGEQGMRFENGVTIPDDAENREKLEQLFAKLSEECKSGEKTTQ